MQLLPFYSCQLQLCLNLLKNLALSYLNIRCTWYDCRSLLRLQSKQRWAGSVLLT